MSNFRKVLSVDDEMLINHKTNTAILFVNQRTGEMTVAKRPVVLKGTTANRLRKKMKRYLAHVHAPVE
jgi:hypothetical protein